MRTKVCAVSTIRALLPCLVLSGCALVPGLRVSESAAPADYPYSVVEITPDAIQDLRKESARVGSPTGLPSLDPATSGTDYLVGPGDVLSVVVWDHPELTNPTGEFRDPVSSGRLVSSKGTLYYPYIGEFSVGGKTVDAIRHDIATALQRVIQNPQIDVRVVAFRSQRVQVTGEVKNPGLVTLDDTPKGILEAINERGGLTPTASRRQAILLRSGVAHYIDLGGLLSGSFPGGNPLIQPGDVIHIPENTTDQVFVLGEVSQQAPVTMKQDYVSLTEVLTSAGGLDRLSASDSGVLVFRRAASSKDKPTIYALDLSDPRGLLLAGEFAMKPRDVVYVKATKFAQYNLIINQLLPTISTVFQVDALVRNSR